MSPQSDRRSRRRLERADGVYRSAIELFVERGYEATKMTDIADRADVARGSVFNYYPRKRAFLDEWLVRRRRQALEAVRASHLADGSVVDFLRCYFDELAAVNVANRKETSALMSAVVEVTELLRDPPLAADLTNFLAQAHARGELKESIDPAQAGLVLAAGYFATIAAWIGTEPPAFDLRRQLHALIDIVTVGVLA